MYQSGHPRSYDWNIATNRYDYPQTPARIQIAVWDGGRDSNDGELIDYAGGLTDWSAGTTYAGGFFIRLMNVTVECYDPPDGANVEGSKAYVFKGPTGAFTNKSVSITDDEAVLADACSSGVGGSRGVGCDGAIPDLGIGMFGTFGRHSVWRTAEEDDVENGIHGIGWTASNSSAASPSASPESDASRVLSTGAKAGIGLGSAVIALLLVVIVLLTARYRMRKRTRDGQQMGRYRLWETLMHRACHPQV